MFVGCLTFVTQEQKTNRQFKHFQPQSIHFSKKRCEDACNESKEEINGREDLLGHGEGVHRDQEGNGLEDRSEDVDCLWIGTNPRLLGETLREEVKDLIQSITVKR